MKLDYDRDTDSLYIKLSSRTSTESEEVALGIVVDYDNVGNITGLDIQNVHRVYKDNV